MLNIEKARNILGWIPTNKAEESIKTTVDWYKHFYEKDVNIYDYTMKQISDYEEKIKWIQ